MDVVLYLVSTTTPHMNILPKPSFAEPIPNVTVSAGRDVSLPCVIENLGNYRVSDVSNSILKLHLSTLYVSCLFKN